MAASIPASLLEHLKDALSSASRLRRPSPRTFDLYVLRSKAHRSHALFPWATDKTMNKVHAHEVLVTASEAGVPVYGLEAGVYTVASSKVALVYVSKVDTTGLLDAKGHPSPAATLTTAFIAHALAHPPHGCTSVRIHIFARAQDQYLFPGSISNAGKRRLTDKELCRWWKRILTDAATSLPSPQLFYLLPGFSYAESLPYVPPTPADSSWTYGHPYGRLRPTMAGTVEPYTLNDLIPAFPDDPKARFLASLTSTPIPPTGEEGDYDDVHARAASNLTATTELTASLALERKRLVAVEGGADEFWERIGYRQECMDGHLTAFFVVAIAYPPASPIKEPKLAVLERASYIHLWSRFHNVEYGEVEMAKKAYETWRGDIEAACANDGVEVATLTASVTIEVATEVVKRPAEEAKAVITMLQPRKKVKRCVRSIKRGAVLTLLAQMRLSRSSCLSIHL